jgi:hypothetical protein
MANVAFGPGFVKCLSVVYPGLFTMLGFVSGKEAGVKPYINTANPG